MAKTLISIKADKEVKENAQKLARELGLSLSDVMNAALRNFIRTRKATFSSIPYMTPELERLLGVVEEDVKAGRNMSPTLSSAEEVSAYLDDL